MGTQQILMIILSVIIVGTAIAIGIQMFDTQLENNTRQTLAAELMYMASQAQAYHRVPYILGGGGNGKNEQGDIFPTYPDRIENFINRTWTGNTSEATFRNIHGTFTITVEDNSGARIVTIRAVSDVSEDIKARVVFPIAGNSSQIVVTQE